MSRTKTWEQAVKQHREGKNGAEGTDSNARCALRRVRPERKTGAGVSDSARPEVYPAGAHHPAPRVLPLGPKPIPADAPGDITTASLIKATGASANRIGELRRTGVITPSRTVRDGNAPAVYFWPRSAIAAVVAALPKGRAREAQRKYCARGKRECVEHKNKDACKHCATRYTTTAGIRSTFELI